MSERRSTHQPPRLLGKKVLLVATAHTGNNVFCTPAIRLLKKHYPDSRLNVACLNRLSAEVFAGNDAIHRIYLTRRQRRFNAVARKHDHIIALHWKSNHLLEHTSVPHVVAPKLLPGTHRAEQTLQFVADYIGCQVTAADRAYGLPPPAIANHQLLDAAAVRPGDVLVGTHLGVGRTAIHGWKFFYPKRGEHPKRWQLERYIELSKQLQHHEPHSRIVLTGTRNEAFLGRQFAREVPGTINLMGQTSVADLVYLMNRLNLFISQDSGIMHIAAGTSVPLVALFGPTKPMLSGPYPLQPHQTVIKRQSMDEIGVADVTEAALDLLRRHPRSV